MIAKPSHRPLLSQPLFAVGLLALAIVVWGVTLLQQRRAARKEGPH